MGKEPAPALQTGHSLVLQSFTRGESYLGHFGISGQMMDFAEGWQLGLVFLQH